LLRSRHVKDQTARNDDRRYHCHSPRLHVDLVPALTHS
jgi:hypothetical protein